MDIGHLIRQTTVTTQLGNGTEEYKIQDTNTRIPKSRGPEAITS